MKDKINAILDSLKLNDNSPEAIINIMREFKEEDAYGVVKNQHLIGNPKVIIDIGAHVGIFSILMSKIYPDATIYAYEAMPDTYWNLRRNLEVNGCNNVHPYNLGVVGSSGKKTRLVAPKENSGGASIVFANNHDPAIPSVDSVTLDEIVGASHVDFMKMDVERAEYEILHKFTKWDQVNYLAIEYHKPLPVPGYVDDMQYSLVHRFSEYVERQCPNTHLWTNNIHDLCYK